MHTVVTVTEPASAPIACTLTASDYKQRLDHLAQLAAGALRSRVPIAGGQRLTFTRTTETEARLRDAVAAEASCCAFLTMRLDAPDDRRDLVLDIIGPAAAQPIITELFAGAAPRRA